MEELAQRLNVPLETIDDPTKQLLKNLTFQLATVARQSGDLGKEDPTIPPELRTRSSIPPELRGSPDQTEQLNSHYSQPSSLSDQWNTVDKRQHSASSHSSTYLSDVNSNQSTSTAQVTVDYSHGRVKSISSSSSSSAGGKDIVTTESILASLQTDINPSSSSFSSGQPSDMASALYSSSHMPLKDKVIGYSQHMRSEMSSQSTGSQSRGHSMASGNGFLPRQLKQQQRQSTGQINQHHHQHRQMNQSRGTMGPRPSINSHSHQPRMGRNW